MSYRFMRILVLFDLPTLTYTNKREYSRFRKYLIKNGFLMLQESVYCKLVLNTTAANIMTNNIRKNKPSEGLVQMLVITEKQFSKIELLVGMPKSQVLNTDERLVVI